VKRLADPYRDLDMIDSRAPRFNQATIGALAAVAVATGWWWLLVILAGQLLIGLTLGRRFCLPCLAYFELVQPRFGEGRLEDARPPRSRISSELSSSRPQRRRTRPGSSSSG
jgi:hypothetical protein